jgi:hypothetical protein
MTFCGDLYFNNIKTRTQVIYSLGIVLNSLCIPAWSRIVWLDGKRIPHSGQNIGNTPAGNTFKYLLVKAVCDLVYFVNLIYSSTFNSSTVYTYWFMFYYLYFYQFGLLYVSFLSALMELLATLGKLN